MRRHGLRYARPLPIQPVEVTIPDYDECFAYRVVGTGAQVPIHDRDYDGRVIRGNSGIIGYEFKENGRDDCGTTKYFRVCCDNPDHVISVPHTCNSAYCTTCYKYWITRASERISNKLSALYRPIEIEGGSSVLESDNAIRDSYERIKSISGYPYRHWTLSFPQTYHPNKKDVFEIMKVFKDFSLMGVVVYHPYRLTQYGLDLCKWYRDLDERESAKTLKPKKYHGNWDVWHKEELFRDEKTFYLSPHLHLVIAGFVPGELEHLLQDRGFVLKMIRVVGRPEIETCSSSVRGLLRYLLSHSAYMGERSGAYRYLSYGNLVRCCKKEVPSEPELITCPYCGAPMRNEGGSMDGGVSMNYKVSKIIYYLKVQKERKIEVIRASNEKYAAMANYLDKLMQRVAAYETSLVGGLFAY